MEDEPKVALLSFSTAGSAEGESVDKVRQALKIVKENRPDILIDGELQFDAALIKEIGKRKAPESMVAGQANVFIFPNLDAGNIGYKITERMCIGATATGPILQGLAILSHFTLSGSASGDASAASAKRAISDAKASISAATGLKSLGILSRNLFTSDI